MIYDELVRGVIDPESRLRYLDVPLFPTARLHAEAAVAFALD